MAQANDAAESRKLPFNLNFDKTPANWTDPNPLSEDNGERKTKCSILLDPSSPEGAQVVETFLKSLREGSEKLAEETSNGIVSAAGTSICLFLLSLQKLSCKLFLRVLNTSGSCLRYRDSVKK